MPPAADQSFKSRTKTFGLPRNLPQFNDGWRGGDIILIAEVLFLLPKQGGQRFVVFERSLRKSSFRTHQFRLGNSIN